VRALLRRFRTDEQSFEPSVTTARNSSFAVLEITDFPSHRAMITVHLEESGGAPPHSTTSRRMPSFFVSVGRFAMTRGRQNLPRREGGRTLLDCGEIWQELQ